MVTGTPLLIIFISSIALLLALIIRFKVNPFLSLIVTSIGTAFLVRMPAAEIGAAMAKGFGSTLSGIGIVIGLGIILGKILSEASATDQVASAMLRRVGDRNARFAVSFTGFLVSIPVFLDAAFVILMPLIRQISRRTGAPLVAMVCALSVAAITSHALVLPTPGPLAVAGNMGVNIGVFLLYALVVSIPAALAGGWFYGRFLGKQESPHDRNPADTGPAPAMEGEQWPPAFLSIFVLVFPILLILLGSILGLLLPTGSVAATVFSFLGDKNIALLLGVLLAALSLKKYIKRNVGEVIVEAADSAGLILLITGAGGAFGSIINTSGIGSYLVETLANWNISILVLAFALSQILRAAQGSTTVALVTTSSIVGPMVASLGGSPALVGLAICAGGVGMSLPNDSGFWVISRFGGLSVPDTLKSWTIGGTIAGLTAFLAVLALSSISHLLPGL